MFKTLSKQLMAAPCRLQTFKQQQRTLVKATTTTLSKNAPRPEQWTKTNLRRLRKNELEDLAREYRMSTAGTKLDLVQRLLQSRKNSTSWPMENTLEHQVEEAVAKHHSYQKNEPGTNATPLDAMKQEYQENVMNGPEREVEAAPAPTAATKKHTDTKDELDAANWIQAFELKASHSHLRQPTSKIRFGSAQRNPHFPVAAISHPEPSSSVVMHMQEELRTEKKIDQEVIPEDVNKVWVKAFEQKANSRGIRRQMLGIESYNSRDAEPNGLEFINSPFGSSPVTTKSPLLHDQVSSASVETNKDNEDKSSTHGSVNSARNWFINSMIGTGLFIWVVGGEDGFKRFADLLISST